LSVHSITYCCCIMHALYNLFFPSFVQASKGSQPSHPLTLPPHSRIHRDGSYASVSFPPTIALFAPLLTTLHTLYEMFVVGLEMSSSDCGELVVTRLSKLHQMLEGRSLACGDYKNLLCPDGLIDVLLVLFDECSKDSVYSKSRHAKAFVEKCELNLFISGH